MAIELILIGILSLLGQVVLLRELNVALYGVELVYILALGAWMFCTAAGARIGRRRSAWIPPAWLVHGLLWLGAALIPLLVSGIRSSHDLFAGVPGAYLDFQFQLVVILLGLLPAGFIAGLLFQWAARRYIGGKRSLALAYSLESAGALLGGLLSTLFLKWGLQNFSIALLCSAGIAGGVGVRLLVSGSGFRRWAALLLPVPFLLLLFPANRLDLDLTRLRHPDVLAMRDTPYGRVTLTRSGEQLTVYENNALSFETQGTGAEEFIHPVLLQHPAPRRVLVLGGGFEGLVGEVLQHSPRQVTYIEVDREMLELMLEYLPEEQAAAFDDQRVRIIITDPRRFVEESGEQFDVILVGMPGPKSIQMNRFYTRRFFSSCSGLLRENGLFAFRIRSSENYWPVSLRRQLRSIFHALERVFPQTIVLPGGTNVFIASGSPLVHDPLILGSRWSDRGIETRLVSPRYLEYLLTNDRFASARRILEQEKGEENTDLRPVSHRYALLIWLSKFFPGLERMHSFSLPGGFLPRFLAASILLVLLVIATLLLRRFPGFRYALLAGLAGFAGMIGETAILLHYQVKNGVLFQDIGLLLTVFMAGLTLGAYLFHRVTGGVRRARSVSWMIGAAHLLVLVLAAGILLLRMIHGRQMSLAEACLFLLVIGMIPAGIFAYAGRRHPAGERVALSPLYAADLLGGSLAAVTGGLLIAPFLGMIALPVTVIAAALAALLLL